jgi:hypothetical protein
MLRNVRIFVLRVLTIACAIYLSGAHWSILQGAAWARMIVDRSQSMSLTQALSTTFDGDHPCEMCNAVTKGVSEEKAPSGIIPKGTKLFETSLDIPPAAVLPQPLVAVHEYPVEESPVYLTRADAPPTPPPLLS